VTRDKEETTPVEIQSHCAASSSTVTEPGSDLFQAAKTPLAEKTVRELVNHWVKRSCKLRTQAGWARAFS